VQIYQADLAKLGITLSIKPLEAAAFTKCATHAAIPAPGQHDRLRAVSPEHALLFRDGGVGRYFGGVDQATVDSVSSELDVAKRNRLYTQMNDFILDQSLDMVIGQTQRALIFPNASAAYRAE